MKKLFIFFLLTVLCCLFTGYALKGQSEMTIEWEVLSEIPAKKGELVQPGLAGAFIGLHNNALIVAGGANFPNGPAWEGGEKVFHDEIYVAEKDGAGILQWKQKNFPLPKSIAYGQSISTERGLLCIGGTDGETVGQEVLLLEWSPISDEIHTTQLPSLPYAGSDLAGDIINDQVYIAASSRQEKFFWSLDLNNLEADWKSLPVWDGSPRSYAIGLAQNDGEENCFYLIKGRHLGSNGVSDLLADMHKYSPSREEWVRVRDGHSVTLSAGTGLAVGANHIFLFGGAEGQMLNQIERLNARISYDTSDNPSHVVKQRDSLLMHHQGFSRDIWAFHTITETWTRIGELPSGSQVTTTALQWDDQLIIPTGEIAPCIRTPNILSGKITNHASFGWLNYAVLFLYLLVLVVMGFMLSRKQTTTHDFFNAGNRIPWWAAGLSIFGTQLSAITFMAIPAKTFATDWLYFFLNMTIIMIAPFIIKYFLPFFRRYNLTTAYEYLEMRFNLVTRLIGSTMYILLQLGRVGIVLLLPSLALSLVSGIDVHLCILTMGILSIIYTVLGGIEAVIWTDVIQVIVLLGGALLALVLLFLDLGYDEISTCVTDYEKMKIFDLSFDLSNPTLWVVVIGGLATNVVQYGSDQTVIQRYLTTKDESSAASGILTGAWLTVPATFIFFTVGTLLFVFYKNNPASLQPALEKTDAIFPWYIVNNLPDGVSGLLIAAIFAASMSSLDSSMNSVSSVITTDFYRRLLPSRTEANYLRLARWITLIIGAFGTGVALLMASAGIASLWDQFNLIIGLFAGGLGGVFVLGIFFKKSNSMGAIAGLLVSGAIQFYVSQFTNIHFLLYAFTGMVSCILCGYLVSLLFANKENTGKKYTFSNLVSKK